MIIGIKVDPYDNLRMIKLSVDFLIKKCRRRSPYWRLYSSFCDLRTEESFLSFDRRECGGWLSGRGTVDWVYLDKMLV